MFRGSLINAPNQLAKLETQPPYTSDNQSMYHELREDGKLHEDERILT